MPDTNAALQAGPVRLSDERAPGSARHSAVVRGLQAAGTNEDRHFEGRFGRMFPDLPAATFGTAEVSEVDALTALASKMVSDFDPPKDGPDAEESGIPALYTYFAQFIDHDLTFGPEGSFQKQKDLDASVDYRTAAFDLDNIYGRGPTDQPYMYAEDGKSLLLGNPLILGSPGIHDLQRNAAGRALIGDPRNDENAIVSQLQGLFLRFHNRVVHDHPHLEFAHAQALVRKHYQYIVVNDFLPRIVNSHVLDLLRGNDGHFKRAKLEFFTKLDQPFIPIEFATAAYRIGHSMIRPGYRLNDAILLPIFPIPAEAQPGFPQGLTGFRAMTQDWGIDWGRFIDIDIRPYGALPLDADPALAAAQTVQNFRRLQFAYRLDTAIVDPLGSLPIVVAGNQPVSLALRNLLRGSQFGLPSGQAVAAAMGLTPLPDDKILIGQGVDPVVPPDPALPSIATVSPVFAGNCPLWTYVLAEAMQNREAPDPGVPVTEGTTISTPQLGPVGGRIVAEVFLGVLFADKGSYLAHSPAWTPPEGPGYRLKDFVAYALGH